jgi:hypothetical protein
MMKIVSVFIFLLVTVLVFSCRTAKRLQKTTEVISNVDTTSLSVIDSNKTVDTAELIKEVYVRLLKIKLISTPLAQK